ncbi:MAG: MnmC family methyltransferase [Candidatus Methylacidiphilales bacterium]|nr:MnmC family methyltransferase [Candidatus Methylacidiphilales bacterium]
MWESTHLSLHEMMLTSFLDPPSLELPLNPLHSQHSGDIFAPRYEWVKAGDGSPTLRDQHLGETFHPELGMVQEIRHLLDQPEVAIPIHSSEGPVVIWDLGLGAGGMSSGLLRHPFPTGRKVEVHSFDLRWDAFDLALDADSPHLDGLPVRKFRAHGDVAWEENGRILRWVMHSGDLTGIFRGQDPSIPAPDLAVVDLHSPETQPELWTLSFWQDVHRCAAHKAGVFLFHTRSTSVRATLLLAGFYVGRGRALGRKEETTLAATRPGMLTQPLGLDWLGTLERSSQGQPLLSPPYHRQPIDARYLSRLRQHPQFHP